ncbi:hypothetical protein A3C37_00710 [Candidatus Peribacteria bacterium RIFCSPHIGHO2_02_FULL_53_20]|nr:MAG: hypothetical protein A3C37_00710 [Candidatus Peribacteria bacterium RIFCSPHIGHO2_02_FULL_53_20]OGJ67308.1 MAG: hypothetical protein A3B61_01200 [Candidatus Peribacteria bacterium RIFCSPLOWO2_01_FULL_53_10]OGJ74196.1 MAG: hypothetical protein A3G69_03165 [Candidatus Peribacteria bacterium RIFCSPLOWO2_12_FULL_53_10]
MRLRRTLVSFGIGLYLFVTANALVYTVFRKSLLPTPVLRYFYGMMAPYQGYSTYNFELVAGGKTEEGAWEMIDLLPYFPGSTGERTFREFLLSRRAQGEEETRKGYEQLAGQLRRTEAEHGRSYTEIRLSFDTWPMARDGYEALRLPAFTRRVNPITLE